LKCFFCYLLGTFNAIVFTSVYFSLKITIVLQTKKFFKTYTIESFKCFFSYLLRTFNAIVFASVQPNVMARSAIVILVLRSRAHSIIFNAFMYSFLAVPDTRMAVSCNKILNHHRFPHIYKLLMMSINEATGRMSMKSADD